MRCCVRFRKQTAAGAQQHSPRCGHRPRCGHAFRIPPSDFRGPEAEHQLFRAFHLPNVKIVD